MIHEDEIRRLETFCLMQGKGRGTSPTIIKLIAYYRANEAKAVPEVDGPPLRGVLEYHSEPEPHWVASEQKLDKAGTPFNTDYHQNKFKFGGLWKFKPGYDKQGYETWASSLV